MTATIIPFPRRPARGPMPGAWVHDLVRGRPMQVVAAQLSQGRPINYTLFDPAFGIDVCRSADQVQFAGVMLRTQSPCGASAPWLAAPAAPALRPGGAPGAGDPPPPPGPAA